MRRFIALLVVMAGLQAAACTTTRADGSPKVQTTSEANREGLKGVAKAPLRDLNVLRTKIPDVLLQAMADPYERPAKLVGLVGRTGQCAQLIDLITPLDDALGPDLDLPAKADQGLLVKGRDTAFGAMAGFASDAIPFHSWVRKLSGAEQHDRLVQNAITAGGVRRAYLKGLGEAKGCDPPATPSHVLAGSPVPEDRAGPRYPIR